jgi:hypothetical protein
MSNAAEYDKLTEHQLRDALCGFQLRVLATAAMLSERCGDPQEAARHVRLALDLPESVMLRQHRYALETASADGEPSIAELAVLIARMTATVHMIEEALARKRNAVTLQ